MAHNVAISKGLGVFVKVGLVCGWGEGEWAETGLSVHNFPREMEALTQMKLNEFVCGDNLLVGYRKADHQEEESSHHSSQLINHELEEFE